MVPRRARRPLEPRRGGYGPGPRRPPRRRRAGLRVVGRAAAPTAPGTSTTWPATTGRPRPSRTSSTPTSAPTWRPACGSTSSCSTTTASSRRCGRWSKRPSTSCSICRPRGEILWARHADGTPWSFALLTGSSSMRHSLRCAIALAELLGHERPDWELSAAQLAHGDQRRARGVRRSTAGPWTGTTRCWAASCVGEAGRTASPPASTWFEDGHGVNCVNDRPWITVAETCECALAYLAVGDREMADPLRLEPSTATTRTAATGRAPSTPTRPASPAASARLHGRLGDPRRRRPGRRQPGQRPLRRPRRRAPGADVRRRPRA